MTSTEALEAHNQPAGGRAQFKWRNCFGDVVAAKFDLVIMDYWNKVAMPALSSAEAEVEHWANSDEGGACFVYSDRLDQRAITAWLRYLRWLSARLSGGSSRRF